MTILAHAGEKIKGVDGKVIATVARDITSGDVNLRPDQFEFAEGYEVAGAFLPEEVYAFIRERLSNPPDEPKAEKVAKPAAKPKKGRK